MGTRFSLVDPNPGVWFSFNEDDADSGRICVRVMNEAERRKIRKATTKKILKRGQWVEDINDDKFSEMLWDYCIVDWEGLEDDAGKPIECSRENKLKLIREHVGFQFFVSTCIERVTEQIENQLEVVEKNSSSTLSDSS